MAWAKQGNIKGPMGATGLTGAQGTPGSTWYSQAGAPASGTGIVGDYSLNTTTGDVYKKTGTSTWTLQGNIKGPVGAAGTAGATGPQGPAGNDGATGAQGPAGAAGAGVPTGGTVGQIIVKQSSTANDTAWETVGIDQSAQISPAGVAAASPGKMLGLGVGNQFTPQLSGKVFVTIAGTLGNNIAGGSSACQLRWGTGTPPANAAAPVGTIIGGQAIFFGGGAANNCAPFSISAVIQGTIGTAMWFDLQLWSQGATATAIVTGATISVFEIP